MWQIVCNYIVFNTNSILVVICIFSVVYLCSLVNWEAFFYNCISIIAGYISDGRLFNRLFIHSTHQYNYCIFNCGNSSIPNYKSLLRKLSLNIGLCKLLGTLIFSPKHTPYNFILFLSWNLKN